MFYNWEQRMEAAKVLEKMNKVFNERYSAKGMAFAMGTHSRYSAVWLLVGVLSLDLMKQMVLF